MTELGVTQEELALRLNRSQEALTGRAGDMTPRSIRNLLDGTTHRPIWRTCVSLEDVFGCRVEDLGFTRPRSMPDENKENPVLRRAFITATSGAVTATATPSVAARHRIGMSDIERLRNRFAEVVARDHRFGGKLAIETQAAALAGEALSLQQRGGASQRVRNGLYAAAASFTSSAMWAAIDGKRYEDAQRFFHQAASLAVMSGDAPIQFRIWSHAGTLYRHLNRAVDALAANDVARNLNLARRDPLYASLGHARHAAIYGLAGDALAVRRALDNAREAFDRAEAGVPRPIWMTAFYDQAELDGLAVTAHLGLGDYENAESYAHRSLAVLRPHMQRSRAITTARLAHAQLGQGDVEPAVSTALKIEEDTLVAHPRVTEILDRFGTRLRAVAPHSPYTRHWSDFQKTRKVHE